jgi:hypothetical protein
MLIHITTTYVRHDETSRLISRAVKVVILCFSFILRVEHFIHVYITTFFGHHQVVLVQSLSILSAIPPSTGLALRRGEPVVLFTRWARDCK